MPSPSASSNGNTKTQKMTSGSRHISHARDEEVIVARPAAVE